MQNRSELTMKEVGVIILKRLSDIRAMDNSYKVSNEKPFWQDVSADFPLKEAFNLDLISEEQIRLLNQLLTKALDETGYAHSKLVVKLCDWHTIGGHVPHINGIFHHKHKSYTVCKVNFSSKEFENIGDIRFADIESAFIKLIDQLPINPLMTHASQSNQATIEKHYEYTDCGIKKRISVDKVKELEKQTRHTI